MSIRYKIFGAFSVVILLACGLAYYGIRGISAAGDQVVRLYDGPLMGINHARSAHAGLNEARLVMQRSLTDGATREAVARFEKLVRNISEDLSVVRDRVQSANVKTAREKAEASLRGWSGAGLKILKPVPGGLTEIPTTFSLTQQGDEVAAALDDLVELVAAYGFDFRKHRSRRHAPPCSGSRSVPHWSDSLSQWPLPIRSASQFRRRCGLPSVWRPAILPMTSRSGGVTSWVGC